jgi:Rhs element Vgr protein
MAQTDDVIFLDEKMDIITCLIKVGDKELPAEYHVTEITIQHGINKIPSANITIIDAEVAKQDFESGVSKFFSSGKKIHIEIGCMPEKKKKVDRNEVDDRLVFDGIIISNSQRVNNNCTELSVVCKDEAEKMTIVKSNSHFKKDITAKEIAEELLQTKNNISNSDIEDASIKHEQQLQSNVSDWDFMIGRIDTDCMICLIENGKVNIKKIELPDTEAGSEPVLKLEHGKNILEFSADMDSRIQNDTIQTKSWDAKEQKLITTEEEADGSTDNDTEKKISPKDEMRTTANLSEEERKSIAKSKKIKKKLSEKKGKIKYLGTTAAAPGDYIELKGVGEKFSGNIFISAVQHEYTDGCWITEATLGWSEQFFSEEINPKHAASGTGQISTMQGLQIGIVTSIEDSNGEYRVQVKLPMVDDKADGLHARVATLDAGNKRGSFFRPEIDDEVIIGFLNDDPSNPIILGMLHSSALPAPLEPEKKNNKKGFVSRSEIKLIFDDGEPSIIIETPGKRIFELNDNTGTITIKDGDGNKIVMEKSGISMEAAQDIKIKAGSSLSISSPKISIKADATLEAEGSASASFKSSGVTELKGSLVNIN